MKRLAAVLTVLPTLMAGLAIVTTTAPADAATGVVKVRLHRAIKNLPVRAETRAGYERSKFRLWIDANGDCQNTRAEVLIEESKVRTTGPCTVRTGKWISYYDHTTFRDASKLDIDHLVPLAEAWDSGAKKWNSDTRKRYANDLADPRTLVAVSAHSNRSKGDRDPADWMPTYGKCAYVRQWVAVKIRWNLNVNRSEKRALTQRGSHCANSLIKVRKAAIHTGSSGGTSGGGSTGTTDPRYDYCYEAKDAGYGPYYQGRDPEYAWYTDSDHDGVVCE
jgi:hypothetical protein